MNRGQSATVWITTRPLRSWAILGLGVACAVFYLFAYNSGYGYDALEYLVIGRSIAEGVPLYTYLPSKSPGIYYLVAWLYQAGIQFDHASLALVITILYAFAVVATFIVAHCWFSTGAAYAIALLTALAAPFMEMNFLQPTILFYLCGLAAFDALLRFERSSNFRMLFIAGIALGIGIAIKSSTAFYGLAAGHFLIMLWTSRNATFGWLCKCGLILAAGVAVVLAGLLAYYAAQGKARAFLDWSFLFPFTNYPSNTTYIAKAYTKLLWVHAFILGCVPLLFTRAIREAALRYSPALLALVFGACAYLALLKTQASHYFFPGAPFLFMFAVFVYEQKLQQVRVSKRLVIAAGAAATLLACTMAVSVAFYRPDAVQRLIAIKDFAQEERSIREFVQLRVDQNEYVLMTGGAYGSTWTYWITHRYPPPPYINVDVKTIWMLRNRPNEVFDVLDDPQLALVQFEPQQLERPILEDVFGNLPKDRIVMQQYFQHVQARFEPVTEFHGSATFWRRPLSSLTATSGLVLHTQPPNE